MNIPRTYAFISAGLAFMTMGLPLTAQQPPPEPNQALRGNYGPAGRQMAGIGRPAPPPVRPDDFFNFFKKDAVSLRMLARVLSASGEELWQMEYEKITLSGKPVPLKIVGNNVVVMVQFIPYMHRGSRWTLLAQGQIWFEDEKLGLRYETTLQTIPIKPGEKAYYFPLGSGRSGDYIEVTLVLHPYAAEIPPSDQTQLPEQTRLKE